MTDENDNNDDENSFESFLDYGADDNPWGFDDIEEVMEEGLAEGFDPENNPLFNEIEEIEVEDLDGGSTQIEVDGEPVDPLTQQDMEYFARIFDDGGPSTVDTAKMMVGNVDWEYVFKKVMLMMAVCVVVTRVLRRAGVSEYVTGYYSSVAVRTAGNWYDEEVE